MSIAIVAVLVNRVNGIPSLVPLVGGLDLPSLLGLPLIPALACGEEGLAVL